MYGHLRPFATAKLNMAFLCFVTLLTNMARLTLCFLLALSAFGQALTGEYSVNGTVRNTVSGNRSGTLW